MAAIYTDVDDLIDAMEEIVPDVKSGYRTTALSWLNLLMAEWQSINPTYEGVRTLDGSFTVVAGTKNYAFTSINSACVAVDIKSFHDGTDRVYHRDRKTILLWDRGWDDTGRITDFTVTPSNIRVWKVPDAANAALYPTISCDYFKRLEPYTAETDALTQFLEQDRYILVKGLEWRARKESEDPEWRNDYEAWKDLVRLAGSEGGSQARGRVWQIGLGPYFDSETEEEL